MLRGAGHSMGQLGRSLPTTAFDSEQNEPDGGGHNDQNHNHGDDDGGHDFPFRQSVVMRTGEGTVLRVVQRAPYSGETAVPV